MRITFHASPNLPDDVAATLVPGEREASLLISEHASTAEIAAALTELVREWADSEWIYVGEVEQTRTLRAL